MGSGKGMRSRNNLKGSRVRQPAIVLLAKERFRIRCKTPRSLQLPPFTHASSLILASSSLYLGVSSECKIWFGEKTTAQVTRHIDPISD